MCVWVYGWEWQCSAAAVLAHEHQQAWVAASHVWGWHGQCVVPCLHLCVQRGQRVPLACHALRGAIGGRIMEAQSMAFPRALRPHCPLACLLQCLPARLSTCAGTQLLHALASTVPPSPLSPAPSIPLPTSPPTLLPRPRRLPLLQVGHPVCSAAGRRPPARPLPHLPSPGLG